MLLRNLHFGRSPEYGARPIAEIVVSLGFGESQKLLSFARVEAQKKHVCLLAGFFVRLLDHPF
jgi:hypothetical protein